MRQEPSYSGCESLDRGVIDKPDAHLGGSSRTKWRAMLDLLIGAPLRLHNYRHLHAEVIHRLIQQQTGLLLLTGNLRMRVQVPANAGHLLSALTNRLVDLVLPMVHR